VVRTTPTASFVIPRERSSLGDFGSLSVAPVLVPLASLRARLAALAARAIGGPAGRPALVQRRSPHSVRLTVGRRPEARETGGAGLLKRWWR